MKDFEENVLSRAGAGKQMADIEGELRVDTRLTAHREQTGLSQREVANLIGVSQARGAAIEQ